MLRIGGSLLFCFLACCLFLLGDLWIGQWRGKGLSVLERGGSVKGTSVMERSMTIGHRWTPFDNGRHRFRKRGEQ